MMVELGELKQHLRIEHNEEDNYLQMLLAMAETACLDFCLLDALADEMPEPVRQAVLIHASYHYTHREGDAPAAHTVMERAVKSLLWPYRDVSKLL